MYIQFRYISNLYLCLYNLHELTIYYTVYKYILILFTINILSIYI